MTRGILITLENRRGPYDERVRGTLGVSTSWNGRQGECSIGHQPSPPSLLPAGVHLPSTRPFWKESQPCAWADVSENTPHTLLEWKLEGEEEEEEQDAERAEGLIN